MQIIAHTLEYVAALAILPLLGLLQITLWAFAF